MAHRGVVSIWKVEEQMGKFSEWHFISKILGNMQVVSNVALYYVTRIRIYNIIPSWKMRSQKEAKKEGDLKA